MHTSPPLETSILGAIGHTPLVELRRIVEQRGLRGRLLAKLEYLNPGGSMKDRIALQIVRNARANGALRDGQAFVELISGNTGTGLAIVCRALGHPFVAVMSKGNSPERAIMMRAFGAEVVLVDQAPGSIIGEVSGEDLDLVARRTEELVNERNAFRADQFANPDNSLAHEIGTGEEIWQQSRGEVDAFVHFAGTGGTFAGVAERRAATAGRPGGGTHHRLSGLRHRHEIPFNRSPCLSDRPPWVGNFMTISFFLINHRCQLCRTYDLLNHSIPHDTTQKP